MSYLGFPAEVRDEDGWILTQVQVGWSSSSPWIATVDGEGVVHALAPGQADIGGSILSYVGGRVAYRGSVANGGPNPARNVVAKAVLPEGTSLISASGEYEVADGVVTGTGEQPRRAQHVDRVVTARGRDLHHRLNRAQTRTHECTPWPIAPNY